MKGLGMFEMWRLSEALKPFWLVAFYSDYRILEFCGILRQADIIIVLFAVVLLPSVGAGVVGVSMWRWDCSSSGAGFQEDSAAADSTGTVGCLAWTG